MALLLSHYHKPCTVPHLAYVPQLSYLMRVRVLIIPFIVTRTCLYEFGGLGGIVVGTLLLLIHVAV